MKDGLLVADDERVAGVVAAAEADDDVGVLGEDVDDLPPSPRPPTAPRRR